jgi:uroporphyrinogen-III decarboxylase
MLVIHHSCGSVAEIMPDIIEIGMDVLESVQPEAAGMNPYELKKKWGDKITFWGCLGSQSIIPFGTPEEIHREVRRLRKEMSVERIYHGSRQTFAATLQKRRLSEALGRLKR